MEQYPETDRTRLRRLPERGSRESALVNAILDEALVCHVGFVVDDAPVVIPTTHARMGDDLIVHGSPASRMLRSLRDGIDVCVTVTLVDGLVLARSAFHHSVNYRSAVIFGRAEEVTDLATKEAALIALVEHVCRGRSAATRMPSEKELRATLVLRLALTEASAKVRTGPPLDDTGDLELPYWAGVLPVRTTYGPAQADCNLAVPTHVTNYSRH